MQMGTKPPESPPPPPAAAAPAPAPAPVAATPTPTPAEPGATPHEPAAPAAPAPNGVQEHGGSIQLPGNIVFDTGKATITPNSGSDQVLTQLRDFMNAESKRLAMLRVEGYTDNV
ncbi:MAG TPA: hypothetical protein VHU80_15395, partial [Polyangiaceae bacterium]|nr:hypothetical protein [Polyangiaceae bacterium]